MKQKRIYKLLAYIFMPVIFSIIGYALMSVALKPIWDVASSAFSVISAEDAPNFDSRIKTIYNPEAEKPEPVVPEASINEDEKESKADPYIRIEDIELPTDGTQYAQLVCERVGLDAPVYWDDTSEILRVGVGQYLGSFLPGFGRMIVLSAHNTSFFIPLEDVEVGDVFQYHTNYCDYEYEVTEIHVLDEKELAKEISKHQLVEEELLIMYTCYPFDMGLGRKTQRFTVFAKRISGYDVRWRASQYE